MTLGFTNTSKQSHFQQKFLHLWAKKFANFCSMEPPCGRTQQNLWKSITPGVSKTWKTCWMKTYSTASTCNIHQHLISDKVNWTSTRSLVGAQPFTYAYTFLNTLIIVLRWFTILRIYSPPPQGLIPFVVRKSYKSCICHSSWVGEVDANDPRQLDPFHPDLAPCREHLRCGNLRRFRVLLNTW